MFLATKYVFNHLVKSLLGALRDSLYSIVHVDQDVGGTTQQILEVTQSNVSVAYEPVHCQRPLVPSVDSQKLCVQPYPSGSDNRGKPRRGRTSSDDTFKMLVGNRYLK